MIHGQKSKNTYANLGFLSPISLLNIHYSTGTKFSRIISLFKNILACNCHIGANSSSCDSNGQCNCKPNIIGNTCNQCNSKFYGFPDCRGLNNTTGLKLVQSLIIISILILTIYV